MWLTIIPFSYNWIYNHHCPFTWLTTIPFFYTVINNLPMSIQSDWPFKMIVNLPLHVLIALKIHETIQVHLSGHLFDLLCLHDGFHRGGEVHGYVLPILKARSKIWMFLCSCVLFKNSSYWFWWHQKSLFQEATVCLHISCDILLHLSQYFQVSWVHSNLEGRKCQTRDQRNQIQPNIPHC